MDQAGPKLLTLPPGERYLPITATEKWAQAFAKDSPVFLLESIIKPGKIASDRLLVVTSRFLFICQSGGRISRVMRVFDVEHAVVQFPPNKLPKIVLKPYPRCNEPSVLMQMKKHPSNRHSHPESLLRVFSYVRHVASGAYLPMFTVAPTADIKSLPTSLVGSFVKTRSYSPPKAKLNEYRAAGSQGMFQRPTTKYQIMLVRPEQEAGIDFVGAPDGVYITGVMPGLPASLARLVPGKLITYDTIPVRTVQEFRDIHHSRVRAQRNGFTLEVQPGVPEHVMKQRAAGDVRGSMAAAAVSATVALVLIGFVKGPDPPPPPPLPEKIMPKKQEMYDETSSEEQSWRPSSRRRKTENYFRGGSGSGGTMRPSHYDNMGSIRYAGSSSKRRSRRHGSPSSGSEPELYDLPLVDLPPYCLPTFAHLQRKRLYWFGDVDVYPSAQALPYRMVLALTDRSLLFHTPEGEVHRTIRLNMVDRIYRLGRRPPKAAIVVHEDRDVLFGLAHGLGKLLRRIAVASGAAVGGFPTNRVPQILDVPHDQVPAAKASLNLDEVVDESGSSDDTPYQPPAPPPRTPQPLPRAPQGVKPVPRRQLGTVGQLPELGMDVYCSSIVHKITSLGHRHQRILVVLSNMILLLDMEHKARTAMRLIDIESVAVVRSGPDTSLAIVMTPASQQPPVFLYMVPDARNVPPDPLYPVEALDACYRALTGYPLSVSYTRGMPFEAAATFLAPPMPPKKLTRHQMSRWRPTPPNLVHADTLSLSDISDVECDDVYLQANFPPPPRKKLVQAPSPAPPSPPPPSPHGKGLYFPEDPETVLRPPNLLPLPYPHKVSPRPTHPTVHKDYGYMAQPNDRPLPPRVQHEVPAWDTDFQQKKEALERELEEKRRQREEEERAWEEERKRREAAEEAELQQLRDAAREEEERQKLEKQRREEERARLEQEKRMKEEEVKRKEEQRREEEEKRIAELERREEEERNRREEEERRRREDEERKRREEEEKRKEEENRRREEERRRKEEEERRRKEEEEKRRKEEEERRKEEEERKRREEEERKRKEEERRKEEEERRKEEEERKRREEEERKRKEEERKKEEEERRRREDEERKRKEEEEKKREEEERKRREEEERKKKEEEEKKRREEEERARREEERRRREEDERRQCEREEAERKRREEEEKMKRDEEWKRRADQEHRVQEEERKKREEEEEMRRRRAMEEEEMRIKRKAEEAEEELAKWKKAQQELVMKQLQEEEERRRRRWDEEMEKRRREDEERRRKQAEEEERRRREDEEERRRRMEEDERRRREDEERRRRDEEARKEEEERRKRDREEEERRRVEELRRWERKREEEMDERMRWQQHPSPPMVQTAPQDIRAIVREVVDLERSRHLRERERDLDNMAAALRGGSPPHPTRTPLGHHVSTEGRRRRGHRNGPPPNPYFDVYSLLEQPLDLVLSQYPGFRRNFMGCTPERRAELRRAWEMRDNDDWLLRKLNKCWQAGSFTRMGTLVATPTGRGPSFPPAPPPPAPPPPVSPHHHREAFTPRDGYRPVEPHNYVHQPVSPVASLQAAAKQATDAVADVAKRLGHIEEQIPVLYEYEKRVQGTPTRFVPETPIKAGQPAQDIQNPANVAHLVERLEEGVKQLESLQSKMAVPQLGPGRKTPPARPRSPRAGMK